MSDPVRTLKHLPWRSLLQVSGFTIVIAIVVEVFLSIGYIRSAAIRSLLSELYAPPSGILLLFGAAVGVGALAVYLLERLHRQVFVNATILWALVPCLALVVFLKSLLPVPALVSLNSLQLLGVVVGVFWKGRPYWR